MMRSHSSPMRELAQCAGTTNLITGGSRVNVTKPGPQSRDRSGTSDVVANAHVMRCAKAPITRRVRQAVWGGARVPGVNQPWRMSGMWDAGPDSWTWLVSRATNETGCVDASADPEPVQQSHDLPEVIEPEPESPVSIFPVVTFSHFMPPDVQSAVSVLAGAPTATGEPP